MTTPGLDSVRVIIFDLDGVLVDSRGQMRHAFITSYREHGGVGEPPLEAFFANMGRPLEEILRRLALPRDMAATYRRASRERRDLAAVYRGIREMLETIRGLGFRLGLMTGKDRVRTLEVLNDFELASWFGDSIVCGDDGFEGKPHPGGLLHLVSALGAGQDPRQAAMVGDASIDVACARAAGVLALGAGWGFSAASELMAAGAWRTFGSPLELETWLRASRPVEAVKARVTF